MSLEKEVGRLADALERIAERFEKLESVGVSKTEKTAKSAPADDGEDEAKSPPKKKAAKKKAAKKTAAKKEVKGDSGPGLPEVRAKCNEVAEEHGKQAVLDALSRFGVKKLTELDEGDYPKLIEDLDKVLDAEESDEEEDDDDEF